MANSFDPPSTRSNKGAFGIPKTPVQQLPRASFYGVEFPIEWCTLVGGIREVLHEYVKRPSGQPEKNGRKQYICRMRAIFDTEVADYGELWPDKLSVLRQYFEDQQTAPLMIPQLKATIDAYCSNWTETLAAAIQSGERVDLEFKEDSDDQFLADQITTAAAQALDSTQRDYESARKAYKLENDKKLTSLSQSIANVVNTIDAFKDQTNIDGQLIASKIDGLVSLCQQASNTVSLQNAANWPVYDALQALWLSAVTASKDLKQAQAKMLVYVTPNRVMTATDVSIAIFQDATHTTDLLQLNNFADAFAIPPATRVNYYAVA